MGREEVWDLVRGGPMKSKPEEFVANVVMQDNPVTAEDSNILKWEKRTLKVGDTVEVRFVGQLFQGVIKEIGNRVFEIEATKMFDNEGIFIRLLPDMKIPRLSVNEINRIIE
ncbi:MAG: hypothetical protein WC752_02160 [Patescibacteria group bacterium]|jgi:hypothetical protein